MAAQTRDGETGMLFHAGSATSLAATIMKLMAKSEYWPEIRASGRQFVEQERTWQRSVANYCDPYARMLKRLS